MSAVVARDGAYLIEFLVDSQRQTLSIGFWEGKQFVCMPMVHCGRNVSVTKSYVDMTSKVLSAVFSNATLIRSGGANADFIMLLERSPGRKASVQ